MCCGVRTTPSSAPSPTRICFSGIGNAYSDEILHRARLSPLTWTSRLADEEVGRLFEATGAVLREWLDRLRAEAGDGFPAKVTAFREGMAVHGRFGQPCPVCGTAVQRIIYAENETNYCPRCQTNGNVLADRSLSRLLKGDWPRSVEEWERAARSLLGAIDPSGSWPYPASSRVAATTGRLQKGISRRKIKLIFVDKKAEVAEWQTRRTQNPVHASECGFKSHLRHYIGQGLRATQADPSFDRKTAFHKNSQG